MSGHFIGVVDLSILLDSFGVDWPLLLIQSINFLLVAFLLYRFAFKNVIKMMDVRREKIEAGLANADKMQREILEFENTRANRIAIVKSEAETIIKSAQSDAKTILDNEKIKSRQISDEMIASAEKEILLREERMLQDLKFQIGSLLVDLSQNILPDQLTNDQKESYMLAAERSILSETIG